MSLDNITNTVTVTSSDADASGQIKFHQIVSLDSAYFEFDCLNTIYNVPVSTSIDFNGSIISISEGYYMPANLASLLQNMFDLIITGTTVTIDPNTRLMTISAPGIFTMDLSNTSRHLSTIMGFTRTTYSAGSSYTGTSISQSAIGTGIFVILDLIQFVNNYSVVSPSLFQHTIYIPWSAFGERMTNTTNEYFPKLYKMNKSYGFSAIKVTLQDIYRTQINLNGSDFLLRINNITNDPRL